MEDNKKYILVEINGKLKDWEVVSRGSLKSIKIAYEVFKEQFKLSNYKIYEVLNE